MNNVEALVIGGGPVGLLAAYCLVSAESYLATHSLGVFRISFAGVVW